MSVYIDYGKYNGSKFITKISKYSRRKMYQKFLKYTLPTKDCKVLDVGVTPDNKIDSNNYFEKMYPWTHNIVMCSVEDARELQKEFPGSRFVQNKPGKPLPFKNGQFDIVFCSAVLEHVGNRAAQRFFLKELIRVGKKVFLTTPNRWYPVEVHTVLPFIHWLPQSLHQKILKLLGKDFFAKTDNLNLLSKRQIDHMLRSIKIPIQWRFSSYKLFGITSNIILYAESKEG